MKKLSGGWVALIAVVVVLAITLISNYNGLVGARENVENKSAGVDTVLQRRLDLIPNLVETVKGYTTHESDVLANIADARARLAGAGTMEEKGAADSALTSSLGRLLAVVEAYPDLKANTQFTALMDELSGTESRISTARRDYNEAVRAYNQAIRVFPKNIFAKIFGFTPYEYFGATEGAETPPAVDFSKAG